MKEVRYVDTFRYKKLKESIEIQSRLKRSEASALAKELVEKTDWSEWESYDALVHEALSKRGYLRSQQGGTCSIRRGLKIKEKK